jgi:hypothetical protein
VGGEGAVRDICGRGRTGKAAWSHTCSERISLSAILSNSCTRLRFKREKSAFLRVLKMQGDEKKELRGCNLEVRVLPNDAE